LRKSLVECVGLASIRLGGPHDSPFEPPQHVYGLILRKAILDDVFDRYASLRQNALYRVREKAAISKAGRQDTHICHGHEYPTYRRSAARAALGGRGSASASNTL